MTGSESPFSDARVVVAVREIFARGQVYSASTAEMVKRGLKAFDHLKERTHRG